MAECGRDLRERYSAFVLYVTPSATVPSILEGHLTMKVKLLLFLNRSKARLVAVLMRHWLVSMSCSRSSCHATPQPMHAAVNRSPSSVTSEHDERPRCSMHHATVVSERGRGRGEPGRTHQQPVLQTHLLSDGQADMFRARHQRGQVLELVVLVCPTSRLLRQDHRVPNAPRRGVMRRLPLRMRAPTKANTRSLSLALSRSGGLLLSASTG